MPSSVHKELYSSLICGSPLPPGVDKQLFLDTGLIHLMVVSGAHLLFLESLLARLPQSVRLSVLGFYCWLTGFGAPVVKAFIFRLIQPGLRARGLTRIQVEAASVVLILCVYPWWFFSRSMQMSWMCGLALSLPRVLRPNVLDQALKAHILLFVFAGASVLSIFWNTLIGPFIGVILFPLCLLVVPFPFLSAWIDGVWEIFLSLLRIGPKGQPYEWFFAAQDLFWIPPVVHMVMMYWEVRWRRASAFSC